jgi:HEAT repeat protein
MQSRIATSDQMTIEHNDDDRDVTRSEAAEYLHDMVGQLSEMARVFGLLTAAEALRQAQRAVEQEF